MRLQKVSAVLHLVILERQGDDHFFVAHRTIAFCLDVIRTEGSNNFINYSPTLWRSTF